MLRFIGLRLGILERVSITGKTDRDIGFRKTGLCYEYHSNFSIGLLFLFLFLLGLFVFRLGLVKAMQGKDGNWIVDLNLWIYCADILYPLVL